MGKEVKIEVLAGSAGYNIPLGDVDEGKVKETIAKISTAGMFNYSSEEDVTTIVPPTAISTIRIIGLGAALSEEAFKSSKSDRIIKPGI